jgi:phosphomevalonate kinase
VRIPFVPAVLSAPANVLLAGEYAITEPGGLGIALAVDPRGRVEVHPLTDVTTHEMERLVREFGSATVAIQSNVDDADARRLLETVFRQFGIEARSGGGSPVARITVDTSTFFDVSTGTKRGLGSSAVATLLTTAAVSVLVGEDPVAGLHRSIARAIGVHRAMHGGRGSGYDVATSAIGGVVRFRGGLVPTAERSSLDRTLRSASYQLFSYATGRPVDSTEAVERFQHFYPDNDGERAAFVERSNEIVQAIDTRDRWCDLFASIETARVLSETVGNAIGVPATLPFCPSHRDDGWIAKTSGAGNERSVLVAERDTRRPLPAGTEALTLDPRGLVWETPKGAFTDRVE